MLKVLNLHLKTAHQADEVDDFEQCGKTDVAPEWNWVNNCYVNCLKYVIQKLYFNVVSKVVNDHKEH